ncbi:MAG TPA: hypothetical protein PLP35_09295 [Caldisericia bacterium]|nr:hypothetical protein [Caldisericia bacterium]HRV75738.1 hypothetical protein [Caldisericia bacterium]
MAKIDNLKRWECCFSKATNKRDEYPQNHIGRGFESLLEQLTSDSSLDYKDGPAIIPSTFKGRRSKTNAVAYSFLTYDFDDFPTNMSIDSIADRIKLPVILHPTYNDNLFSKRKLRAYVLCKEIEPAELYETRWLHYSQYFDGLGLDVATKDRTRLNYTLRKNANFSFYFSTSDLFGEEDTSGRGWLPYEVIENQNSNIQYSTPIRTQDSNATPFLAPNLNVYPFEHVLSPPFALPLGKLEIPKWCFKALKFSANQPANTPFFFNKRHYKSRSELEYLIVSELIACGLSFEEISNIFQENTPGSFKKHLENNPLESNRWLKTTYENALYARNRKKSMSLFNKLNSLPESKRNLSDNRVLSALSKICFQLNSTECYRSFHLLSNDSGVSSRTVMKSIDRLQEQNKLTYTKGSQRESSKKGVTTRYDLTLSMV